MGWALPRHVVCVTARGEAMRACRWHCKVQGLSRRTAWREVWPIFAAHRPRDLQSSWLKIAIATSCGSVSRSSLSPEMRLPITRAEELLVVAWSAAGLTAALERHFVAHRSVLPG